MSRNVPMNRGSYKMVVRALALAIVGGAAMAVAPSCSLSNSDGPKVTCADLECGRVNACENGIIAQCLDRQTVQYHVCKSNAEDVCAEDWQTPGAYRCLEFQTDCEGCRPERTEGCAASEGGGGSGADGGGGSGARGGGGSGGEAGASGGGGSGGSGGAGGGGSGGTGGT